MGAKSVGTGLGALVVDAFLGGWLLMLLIGMLHADINAGIHTVGYWNAVVMMLLARLLAAMFDRNSSAA